MPLSPILFFGKSYVGSHVRRLKNGKVITVGPYYDKRIKKGTEHVRAPLGRDFEDVEGLSPESMALLERMHKEQHLLHHYHAHALQQRVADHELEIQSLTEQAKAHRAAGREVEATKATNRALRHQGAMHRHARELAKVKAKVAGIGAMMAKISPGAGDVYDSTEDSHKQYVDKMGSRWKASPRSPAKVTIPPAVEQSLMRLLGGFRSYAEGLERARATDQQFNGDGRYANEYAQNNKDRLEASEAFLAAKLGSIVNAANRAAADEFIAKHRPDTNLTAHEQGFFGAKPADKKDEAIQAAVDHLKEDATQQDIPAKEKREDAALVAKLEGAKDAEPKATGGESGPFGPIFRQFHHDAQGAIEHLKQAQTGEAVAALHHPEVGDIDLVWGRTSDDPRSTGEGLAKLLRWHPEVLGDLQGFISSLHVHQKHKTRIHLTNDLARRAAVRLDYSGKTKTWLLTAYEVNSGGDRSGVGSASGGISAAAGRKDETILAPSPSASDDSSIAQAVGSGKDSAPQEGEVNAEGLVFRGGRWHRDGAGQKPEAAKTQQSTPAGDDSLDPNSPNYRYRDTGVIEGARKFNVTEAFREAARKGQLVRYQNIDWGELEENPRRAKELITKSNLFGKVDWDSLKEQGMEPGAGFLIDRVYASIASAPEDSPERRKDYALGIGSLRDRLETCKTPDEVKKTLSEMGDEFKGEILSARESEEYKAAYSRYQEIMGRVRAVDKQSDALYEPVKEMLNELRTLTYERDKRARRGWKPDPDSAAKIAEITQRMEAAEKRFRDFRAENASYLDNKHRELGNGRSTYASDVEFEARHALDHANSILRLAALRNMQSNPVTRAWVSFGAKFQQLIQGRNDTFNGHRANVRAGNVSDWSWAEKTGSTPRSTKKGAQFQLLVADKIERVGGKDVLSASTEELKAQFGLRDVQSGNWVLKDVGSAQWHVQRGTEALSDLADLVGADPKQIAMNGRLALAFGARGTGNAGYGGAARAHYEPVDRVINITKMQGGGSLGHEWFHALDNLIGDLHGKQGGAIQFSSEEPEGLPAGLKDAFVGLTNTMMSGEHRMQQRVIVTDSDRSLAKNYFDRPEGILSKKIVAAGDLLGAIQAIDQQQSARQEYLARRGKRLPLSERKNYDHYRLLAAAHYGPAGATTVSIPSGAAMSSFALEARKLDQGKSTSYWGTPKEMAARAFSAYCEDRLSAQGRKNDYLSSHADNKFYQDPIFGDSKPFPEGEERTRINAAFDRLFAAMAESNTFAKALAMLEAGQSRVLFFKSYIPAHTRHLKNGQQVQVAAYYDKRSRKGVELAGGHHHDLSHLDDTQRAKFEQMHQEQHLLHHYQAHALKRRIAEHEATKAAAEKEAQGHRDAGRHVEAAKAANRALRVKARLTRHHKELAEVNAKVAGIGAMKNKMVAGSGDVGESTDEGHNVYAKKLGARWKKPLEGGKPTIVRASARSPAPAADFDDDDQFLDIDGKDVPFEYRLVEADSLGASKGKADNQYRDRTRAASDEQVGSIANNLKFRMLSGSPVMDYGAPVLAMDGETIIAGNGRTLAIQRAYGSGKAQAYKDDLSRKAHRYGLSKDAAAGMKEPVLVRVLSKDVDVRQAAIASNEGGGARMSNLEQAKVDGERLGDLSGFSTNDAGEFNTPANMPFIRQFLGAMPASQRGAFLAADGRLSQEGINRVRNAILYRAYGDSDTLARQVESADAGQRNVLNALVSVAPIVAQAKQDAKIGRIHDLDISADIVAATATLAKIKEERKFGSVDEYLSQAGLFGDEISDEAQLILRHFGEHLRSAKAISEFLAGYYDAVNRLGDPNQMDIFDDAPTPKKTDLLRNSHGTRHEEQAQLF